MCDPHNEDNLKGWNHSLDHCTECCVLSCPLHTHTYTSHPVLCTSSVNRWQATVHCVHWQQLGVCQTARQSRVSVCVSVCVGMVLIHRNCWQTHRLSHTVPDTWVFSPKKRYFICHTLFACCFACFLSLNGWAPNIKKIKWKIESRTNLCCLEPYYNKNGTTP